MKDKDAMGQESWRTRRRRETKMAAGQCEKEGMEGQIDNETLRFHARRLLFQRLGARCIVNGPGKRNKEKGWFCKGEKRTAQRDVAAIFQRRKFPSAPGGAQP